MITYIRMYSSNRDIAATRNATAEFTGFQSQLFHSRCDHAIRLCEGKQHRLDSQTSHWERTRRPTTHGFALTTEYAIWYQEAGHVRNLVTSSSSVSASPIYALRIAYVGELLGCHDHGHDAGLSKPIRLRILRQLSHEGTSLARFFFHKQTNARARWTNVHLYEAFSPSL